MKRLVYTSSNSVVMGGKRIAGATRRCPTPTGSMTFTPRPKWSLSDLCCRRTVLKGC
ncbi:3 beta-hydroxysteroid dehydrogenase/Delta 5--_4-isomerase domain protein [Mycobacterium xenopi 4042]|uniref:3 beta-hydroxysteroid dehydrogenase/Delta 5-->4-isomerase domain protein n=1 Tax=Mycobacterium xenopi 4042 TaxID=1299334 RepID=X8ANR0_MYCXE|nr:3 beta-hydroxysteroid dehydrogenase/Delta 5-->4-isomerase domain protein [Mycobacterium xenopi 4042]